MHRAGVGMTQQEHVQQVRDGDESIYDFGSYVPVGSAVEKLRSWSAQGAGVLYLSSQAKSVTVEQDKLVRIKSIVVEEFGGIDHLPGELSALVDY